MKIQYRLLHYNDEYSEWADYSEEVEIEAASRIEIRTVPTADAPTRRHDVAALVREFHESFRLPLSDTPSLADSGLARQRHQLLLQEVTEVYDAVLHNNLPGIAQELADCVYVLYGTALTYGIELDAVLAAVHAANMTKLGADGKPIMKDGKVMKGPNYVKPDIAVVLVEQG